MTAPGTTRGTAGGRRALLIALVGSLLVPAFEARAGTPSLARNRWEITAERRQGIPVLRGLEREVAANEANGAPRHCGPVTLIRDASQRLAHALGRGPAWIRRMWTTRRIPAGVIFVDGASASDVKQGKFGTCWVLAPSGGLARTNPMEMEPLIRPLAGGGYAVTVYDGGRLCEERLLPSTRIPRKASRSTQDGELWVTLVEAAIAQHLGGYDAIGDGGDPRVALTLLTGYPAVEKDLGRMTQRKVWQTLRRNMNRAIPTVLGTRTNLWTRTFGLFTGLARNHAYAFLDAREDDSGKRWVYLSNPWGGSHLKLGTFRMPLDQFMKHFEVLWQVERPRGT